jgi:L-alanine-DL-glutamate epimerase-like enolase superfamily enzyme
MRITAIHTVPAQIGVRPEFMITSSKGTHRVSPFLLVRIDTDDGIEGAGEATTMPRWSGETCWTAKTIIDHVLAPGLIGADPSDIASIDRIMDGQCSRNWFAKAAIEMACWDIRGKAAGKPVYELLGGAKRSRTIPARFSMAAYEPATAAAKAIERVEWGFQTIKIKVGTKPADDVARVRAVRDAVGPDIAIVIDANCGWDAETAIRCCRELKSCRLALVEQPTPDGDYDALARVRRAIDVPVMADDMCFDLVHAQELLRHEACDVISVYPGKNGGIRKSAEIVDLAAQHGVACTIGSNLEWDVATAAMAHLVVAMENVQVEKYPGDILGPWYHEERIVREPLRIERATCTIPDAPGLGITVDWRKADTLRCANPFRP